MEFEALDAVIGNQAARLADAELALVRIDRGERDQHVGVLACQLDHLVIAVAAEAGLALGIDRKDHRGDLALAVIGRGLRHGRRVLVRRLEIFRHLGLEVVIAVVAMAAARLLGMGMNIDGDQFVRIDQLHAGNSLGLHIHLAGLSP